jgi:hypothetical protein
MSTNHPSYTSYRLFKNCLLLVLAIVVSGCSFFGSDEKKKEAALTRSGNDTCPNIQILADLREKTVFRPGPGRDKFDILYAGQISEYFIGCSIRRVRGSVGKLSDVPRTLAVRISPVINARRNLGKGAAKTVNLDYFVGVVKSDETPVEKKIIPLSVVFKEDFITVPIREKLISLVIKLQPGERISDYSVFLGFQLDKNQLLFNREQMKGIRKLRGL